MGLLRRGMGSAKRRALNLARRIAGPGYVYWMPKRYDDVIVPRFGEVRQQAFSDLIAAFGPDKRQPRTVIDIACGSGLSTLWLAQHLPDSLVVGTDRHGSMLAEARRRVRSAGVADRCKFVRADARTVSLQDFGLDGPADLIVASLAFSVIPDWEAVFESSIKWLAEDGTFAIFDQYAEDFYLHTYNADQSRKSWLLVEGAFQDAETTWYDNDCFLAVGRGRRG